MAALPRCTCLSVAVLRRRSRSTTAAMTKNVRAFPRNRASKAARSLTTSTTPAKKNPAVRPMLRIERMDAMVRAWLAAPSIGPTTTCCSGEQLRSRAVSAQVSTAYGDEVQRGGGEEHAGAERVDRGTRSQVSPGGCLRQDREQESDKLPGLTGPRPAHCVTSRTQFRQFCGAPEVALRGGFRRRQAQPVPGVAAGRVDDVRLVLRWVPGDVGQERRG